MMQASHLYDIAKIRLDRWQVNRRARNIAAQVKSHASPRQSDKPVVIFNASTRLVGISLNAAFSLLTSWALRLQNVPVVHFVCQAGMSRCVQGTDRTELFRQPPCKSCMAQSRWLYSGADVTAFSYREDSVLAGMLQNLSIHQLMEFTYQPLAGTGLKTNPRSSQALPLGQLVLPSIRWVLRRHHLVDDEPTRYLYQQFMLSAARIAEEFSALLNQTEPQAVVLFNGQLFPEATARWISLQHGIRTITHEVGLQPLSAFFTTGEATAYPLHVPDDFQLSQAQDVRLDAYLSQRFQGQFSMAGVRFWPEMKGLDEAFIQKASAYQQVVPIFTNVIFDTSQPHSNVVFPHMFAWLDLLLELVKEHPETLFVIRAHPDEARPGKTSQESVRQWVALNHVDQLPNLIFVDSHQSLSSYELIQRSKFVMIYNSTIGLEASILGVPVLCAGRARFTQLPTVFFPSTPQEYRQTAQAFLSAEKIPIPPEFQPNARRFLYYQLFYSSLPFGDFIEPDRTQGFVHLRPLHVDNLSPESSPTIKVLVDGILDGKAFLLNEEQSTA